MKRWFTRRRMLVLLLIATVLTPFAWIFGRRAYSEWDLNRVLAHLDATDPGWRMAHTLAKRSNVPDEQNTAFTIVAFGSVIESKARNIHPTPLELIAIDKMRKPMHGFTKEQFATIEKEMALFNDILPAMRALKDATPGHFLHKDQMFIARRVLNFLDWDIKLHLALKQNQTALNSWLAQWSCSRSIATPSDLMSVIIRTSLRMYHFESLQVMLGQSEWTNEQVAVMQEEVEKDMAARHYRDTMRIERAILSETFAPANRQQLQKQFDRPLPWENKKTEIVAWIEKVRSEDFSAAFAFGLRYYTTILDLDKITVPERAARLEEVKRDLVSAPSAWKRFEHISPAANVIIDLFLRDRVQCRCAQTALACERFRLANGRWPKAVSELTPKFLKEVPADEYREGPLGLRHFADGIVIYSVGKDGVYDGSAWEYEDADQKDDLYSANLHQFRLWNPENRGTVLASPGKETIEK